MKSKEMRFAGLVARMEGMRNSYRILVGYGAHPASYLMDTRGSFPGDKVAGA
jgi:hypothetical protein